MTRETLWTGSSIVPSPGDTSGRYDTIVVGGGLTGLTTAALLARAGQSVLLLEADRLGGVTTRRSNAKVSLLQGTRLGQLARHHGAEVVRAYVEAGREGQAWLRRFCDDHGVPYDVETAYTYATTPDGESAVREEHDRATEAGLPTRLEHELPVPFEARAAVALDDQLQVDPTEVVGALAREALDAGARLVEGARVRRVRGRGPFRVTVGRDEATADAVVVATNYPVVDQLGHFAWFTAQRSYVLALAGDGPPGMYLSAEQPSRSLRTATVDGRPHLLVGGQGHRTGGPRHHEPHLDELRGWGERHFGVREEVAAWSAQDYATADGLPWIGPLLPGVPRLVAAGGYSKWGFTTAPAAALALAGELLGERPTWAEPLASWRSRAPGLLGAARNGLTAGASLGAGWTRALLPPARAYDDARVDRQGLRPAATSATDGQDPERVSAVCTHLGGVVGWNDVERSWDCPLHGSRFGPDGEVLEGPATCGLRRI